MLTGRLFSGVCVCVLAALLSLTLGGCNSIPPETGPTLGVRNDSDAPLRATFWVGDRGSSSDLSRIDQLEIPPYGTKQFRLGAFSGYESATASFIRVQVEPVGPSFQAQTQYWYELTPPSPYIVRVAGSKPKLQFERAGGGALVAVPRDLWYRGGALATTPTPAPTRPAAAALTKPAATTTPGAIKPMTPGPSQGKLTQQQSKIAQPIRKAPAPVQQADANADPR